MASPSYTYTLTNGTTADASQVMQDFNDILNGVTDGTKDLSISALTCAGTATLNGNVNLGNSTSDDLSITASLASSIAIKTTNTYNIGSSTLGLASVYFGGNGQTVRILGSSSMSATWSLTLPTGSPTIDYSVLSATTAGVSSWRSGSGVMDSPLDAQNYSISASVSSNALTIALKDAAGNDPSASSPVSINFRSETSATGTYTTVNATAATSVVVSSGSTLGHSSAVASPIYVYAINNAGTIELAVSSQRFDDATVQSSSAEGGAGAADSATTLYSTTARSSKAIRLLARMFSSQTVAGTWAAVPTEISLGNKFLGDAKLGDVCGIAIPQGFVGYYTSQAGSATGVSTGFTNISTITLPTVGHWLISVWAACFDSACTAIEVQFIEKNTLNTTLGDGYWIYPGNSVAGACGGIPTRKVVLSGSDNKIVGVAAKLSGTTSKTTYGYVTATLIA